MQFKLAQGSLNMRSNLSSSPSPSKDTGVQPTGVCRFPRAGGNAHREGTKDLPMVGYVRELGGTSDRK